MYKFMYIKNISLKKADKTQTTNLNVRLEGIADHVSSTSIRALKSIEYNYEDVYTINIASTLVSV